MKLSFEGRTIRDVTRQMEDMLAVIAVRSPGRRDGSNGSDCHRRRESAS